MDRLDSILRTELVDGSVVSTVYLGESCPGPNGLDAVLDDIQNDTSESVQDSMEGYWFETCLLTGEGECRVLRRHKTQAEAIVWHEDYLDRVIR